MAFVMIERGQSRFKVSRKSYENLFKDKGYHIVGEQKQAVAAEPEQKEPVKEEQETSEIPVSEMSKEQLMEYAKQHGIDTSHAKNVREARQIIQEEIRKRNM